MSWPWRELEGLFTAFSGGPAAMLETAIRAAGDRVLGREVTMRVGEHDVTLTPTELDTELATVGLALGQIPLIRIVAKDVAWPGTPVQLITITCRDIQFQSLPTPSAIAGSVEVEITITAEVVRAKVAELQPNLIVEIGQDSVTRVRWAPRRTWGHLEVEPVVADEGVLLMPRYLEVARMRFAAVQRMRPTVVEIPDLPRGLRLTAVQPGPGHLVLRGEAEQWHEKIPLTDLLGWLATAAATLTLPKFPRRDNVSE